MRDTYYSDGRYRKYGSFENKEEYDFPDGVGKIPIYNVDHEEAETLPTYIGKVLGKGCDYCDFKIALGDEYVDSIKMIGKLGLGNPEKVDVKGVKVAPRDVVNAVLPDPSQLGHLSKGQCAIGAVVRGTKNGRKAEHYIWTSLDHKKTWDKCDDIRERNNQNEIKDFLPESLRLVQVTTPQLSITVILELPFFQVYVC